MSIVLCATMLIAVLCIAPATAAAATTDDGLIYTIANNEVTITGYNGAGGDLVIPAEIEGSPVTALGKTCFRASANPGADKLTSIVVPDSVKTIGTGAFLAVQCLKQLHCQKSAVFLQPQAFSKTVQSWKRSGFRAVRLLLVIPCSTAAQP